MKTRSEIVDRIENIQDQKLREKEDFKKECLDLEIYVLKWVLE